MTDQIKPKLSQDEYVKQGGTCCPFCKSTDIVGDSIEIDCGTASQEVSCNDCNGEWKDQYDLAGFTYHV